MVEAVAGEVTLLHYGTKGISTARGGDAVSQAFRLAEMANLEPAVRESCCCLQHRTARAGEGRLTAVGAGETTVKGGGREPFQAFGVQSA